MAGAKRPTCSVASMRVGAVGQHGVDDGGGKGQAEFRPVGVGHAEPPDELQLGLVVAHQGRPEQRAAVVDEHAEKGLEHVVVVAGHQEAALEFHHEFLEVDLAVELAIVRNEFGVAAALKLGAGVFPLKLEIPGQPPQPHGAGAIPLVVGEPGQLGGDGPLQSRQVQGFVEHLEPGGGGRSR